ncbi:Uncharacterized protein SCF082_LOCUS18119 [Durusdinium trenchii]|uniref:Uncharacterized protein n=1 Tax=Durusdinium trenchii TaxID=1381693 RepID=A0ABP0KPK1_9DINO
MICLSRCKQSWHAQHWFPHVSLGFQLPISLEIAGWSKVHGGREASVAGKCFNYDAPLEYFLLLQHHLTHMESYDEAFGVRHSQSKAYYDTLRTRFKTDKFDIVQSYVPPGQALDFYKDLKAFFSGAQEKDPRIGGGEGGIDLLQPFRAPRNTRKRKVDDEHKEELQQSRDLSNNFDTSGDVLSPQQ